MRFNAGRFNRHLDNLGQDYLWHRRYACACIDPANGQPDHRCPTCRGLGHVWNAPVPARAATANQKTQANWAAMGQYETGDIVMTVPENSPMWDAGQFDRVTMANGWDRFSISLHRGRPNERLHFSVRSLERAFYLHPQTRAIVEVGLPEVDAEGRITWGESAPPAGVSYSLTGTKPLEYFIFQELPRNRNMHSGMRLPKMTVMRRFDLLGR